MSQHLLFGYDTRRRFYAWHCHSSQLKMYRLNLWGEDVRDYKQIEMPNWVNDRQAHLLVELLGGGSGLISKDLSILQQEMARLSPKI